MTVQITCAVGANFFAYSSEIHIFRY